MRCKNFAVLQVDGRIIIESSLQAFSLRGINGNVKQLEVITQNIKPTSSLNDLVGLFYARDIDGYRKEQLVEMYPVRRDYATKEKKC